MTTAPKKAVPADASKEASSRTSAPLEDLDGDGGGATGGNDGQMHKGGGGGRHKRHKQVAAGR